MIAIVSAKAKATPCRWKFQKDTTGTVTQNTSIGKGTLATAVPRISLRLALIPKQFLMPMECCGAFATLGPIVGPTTDY